MNRDNMKLVKCGEQTALSKRDYKNNLQFRCWKCNALRPIRLEVK